MDSEWFHDDASRKLSQGQTILLSRDGMSTPHDLNANGRDSADVVSQRQRDSGVSSGKESGEPSLMKRFIQDSRSAIAESRRTSVSSIGSKFAAVTMDNFRNEFRGQRVAKTSGNIYAMTMEYDKLRIPAKTTSRRDRVSSHCSKEVEKVRGQTGRSSPEEVTTDIPILSSEINNNIHADDLDDEVFLPNPTTVHRSKPTQTKRTSDPQRPPSRNDSGHSSGSSCHSAKSCKHYTNIYHQYAPAPAPPPPPQLQTYYSAPPIPPPAPPQYYSMPQYPSTAPLPRRHVDYSVYDDAPVSKPRRETSSIRYYHHEQTKSRKPSIEETRRGLRHLKKSMTMCSLLSKDLTREIEELDAVRHGFNESVPFSNSKPIPAPLSYSASSPVIPERVTISDVCYLVNLNRRYQPFAQIIQDTLSRRNVRNYIAELQHALERHADVLGRKIGRFQCGASRTNHPAFSTVIADNQRERDICYEKADELRKICQRDANGAQRLPKNQHGPQPSADNLNYQYRLIYGCFSY